MNCMDYVFWICPRANHPKPGRYCNQFSDTRGRVRSSGTPAFLVWPIPPSLPSPVMHRIASSASESLMPYVPNPGIIDTYLLDDRDGKRGERSVGQTAACRIDGLFHLGSYLSFQILFRGHHHISELSCPVPSRPVSSCPVRPRHVLRSRMHPGSHLLLRFFDAAVQPDVRDEFARGALAAHSEKSRYGNGGPAASLFGSRRHAWGWDRLGPRREGGGGGCFLCGPFSNIGGESGNRGRWP
jgi:hypothetical protein